MVSGNRGYLTPDPPLSINLSVKEYYTKQSILSLLSENSPDASLVIILVLSCNLSTSNSHSIPLTSSEFGVSSPWLISPPDRRREKTLTMRSKWHSGRGHSYHTTEVVKETPRRCVIMSMPASIYAVLSCCRCVKIFPQPHEQATSLIVVYSLRCDSRPQEHP